eukprot:CAMPEP_0118814768 /NCGR_PEP_ID=MMETSP1162-20130426/3764_1 /TAXON_ID=33656 /ORGANISM="Phaeocystis Sp, Strain CCMP2710" /LENGTH=64 /DNA_ID=CAMNT_0006744681 /DNA_START=111 /DNA_END=302 /DNA_ORIENTATION=+
MMHEHACRPVSVAASNVKREHAIVEAEGPRVPRELGAADAVERAAHGSARPPRLTAGQRRPLAP